MVVFVTDSKRASQARRLLLGTIDPVCEMLVDYSGCVVVSGTLTLRGVLDFPCGWHAFAGRRLVTTGSLDTVDGVDSSLSDASLVL